MLSECMTVVLLLPNLCCINADVDISINFACRPYNVEVV